MNTRHEISIILPYFGKMPELSSLFFFSCRYNPNLFFLLFTDQEQPPDLPANVEFHSMRLQELNQLVTKKLGAKITLVYSYKLCDLKPMYGKIFEDYLKESKFWGYCDLDMIFGNSTQFLTPFLLNSYEIISARKDSLAGNFTLYKNTERTTGLFLFSDCWEQIARDRWRVYSFPERFKPKGKYVSHNLFYQFAQLFHSPRFSNILMPDMNTIVRSQKDLKVHYGNFMLSDMILRNSGIFNWEVNWEDGKLTERNSKKDLLYFHFYFLKNKASYSVPKLNGPKPVKSISITPTSIRMLY